MSWIAVWFSGAGGAAALGAINYLVGPWAKARKRRERFFDLAFGHDGSDGLPETKDIFTRLGNVEHVVTNAALLNGKGEMLVADVKDTAAKAVTLSKEVRHVQRGVNAIRAELDTYAKVVSRDTAELWSALAQAGIGRRETDPGGN